MPDDLVDRILQKRKAEKAEQSLQARLAVDRISAVEENADWFWDQITERVRFLVNKYNGGVGANERLDVNPLERDATASQRIEVNHPTFPIAKLTVWRPSNHFLQFSWERIEHSFAPAKTGGGRIDFTAQDRNKIRIETSGGALSTPQAVAEHVLGYVLDDSERK